MFVNVSLVDFSQYIPWWNRGRRQLRTVNPTFTQTLVSAPGAPASPLATSQEAATPLALRVAARAHRTPPSGLRRAAAESWLTASRQPPPPALGPQIPLRVGPATLRLAAQAQRILRLQPQLRRSKPPWPRYRIAETAAAGAQRPPVLAPSAPAPPTVPAHTALARPAPLRYPLRPALLPSFWSRRIGATRSNERDAEWRANRRKADDRMALLATLGVAGCGIGT